MIFTNKRPILAFYYKMRRKKKTYMVNFLKWKSKENEKNRKNQSVNQKEDSILWYPTFFSKVTEINMPPITPSPCLELAERPRMQFYTQDHENWCQWCSASTLNMKENKNKQKTKTKKLISSPRPTLWWDEGWISDFFFFTFMFSVLAEHHRHQFLWS